MRKERKQIILGSFSVVRETEKAYLLRFEGTSRDSWGGLFYSKKNEEFWAPKSAIEKVGDGYIVARWWKLRDGDLALDSTRWPGRKVLVSIDPQVRDYEGLLRMGDYALILFERAMERGVELPVEETRQGVKLFFSASLVEELR